jgi:excisionase family DNA binding protein
MAKSVFAVPQRQSLQSARSAFASEERLTVRDVAQRMGVSEWTVYRWVATKRLPCIKVSNRVLRFNLSDIEQYEKAHTSGRV